MNSLDKMEEIDRLARLCAEKDAENVRLNEGWHNANFEALQAKQQLSEAQSQIAEKDAAYEQLKETTFKSLDYANEEMRNLETQIAMQAEALRFENEMRIAHNFKPLATTVDALSATSETVAAWRAKETEPLRREVAMLEAAMKPAYCFYMIEVERVGWFSGKKEGRLHFTHSVEDAITFFDKHSAEIILNEFFGSAVSYMHPETYGRVLVTEHMWCNRPSNTQATALAYEREVENRGAVKELEKLRSIFAEYAVLDHIDIELRASKGEAK